MKRFIDKDTGRVVVHVIESKLCGSLCVMMSIIYESLFRQVSYIRQQNETTVSYESSYKGG